MREWWKKKVDEDIAQIPDFGGFVVKADSEGQPGPSSYKVAPRTLPTQSREALKPHGGFFFIVPSYTTITWTGHNPKNDRARAAYDIFQPLDGKFDDNVIIQIKHGPIDFQAREHHAPLFAGPAKPIPP